MTDVDSITKCITNQVFELSRECMRLQNEITILKSENARLNSLLIEEEIVRPTSLMGLV